MLTELGKILKIICTKADIKQKEMAKDLGISTGNLSDIMAGKTVPKMDILGKCIERYGIKGKEIRDLFSSAFSSAAKNNHTIILDTRHFKKDRVDFLIKIITIFLLQKDLYDFLMDKKVKLDVITCYNELDSNVEYPLPYQEERTSPA
jgi:transcriptional regulator with XRE-family HTH domain